jgi:HK97 gp10 family phage protein
MSFSIKLISETVTAKLSGLPSRIMEKTEAMLNAVGADMEDLARTLVPVRTGYLRSTIYHRVENMSLEVGAEADYATYVELGTRCMAARPYLRPAVDAFQERLLEAVRDGVLNALED